MSTPEHVGFSGLPDAPGVVPSTISPPSGTIHCVFHSSGNHYTWKKVTTTVHNIIVGKLWIDQVGSRGWEVYGGVDLWGMGHGWL